MVFRSCSREADKIAWQVAASCPNATSHEIVKHHQPRVSVALCRRRGEFDVESAQVTVKIWISQPFLQEVNETNETNGTNESSFMDLVDPQMGSPIQAGSNAALSQRLCEGFIDWTLVQSWVCEVESTPLSIIDALEVERIDSISVESRLSFCSLRRKNSLPTWI